MPPDKDFSCLINDEGEGVSHDERTESFGYCGYRVKDRSKEHQHGGNYADGLPDVTLKYAYGCQHPGKTHGEYNQRQQYQGGKNRRPMQVAVKECKGCQYYTQANETLKERCIHSNNWQYFNWKYHFFNVIDVRRSQLGRG
jgi:hypothetical protein